MKIDGQPDLEKIFERYEQAVKELNTARREQIIRELGFRED